MLSKDGLYNDLEEVINPSKEYIEKALRTESIEGAGIRLQKKPALARGITEFTKMAEDQVDNIKKYIYYGKPSTTIDTAPVIASGNLDTSDTNMRLLHAGLGMLTEAAEFLLPIMAAIEQGVPLDKVNLKEELGDLQWYQAIACDELNTDFETEQERNIAKLTLRYPDKFTEDKAINRNLKAEREVLENDNTF